MGQTIGGTHGAQLRKIVVVDLLVRELPIPMTLVKVITQMGRESVAADVDDVPPRFFQHNFRIFRVQHQLLVMANGCLLGLGGENRIRKSSPQRDRQGQRRHDS